MADLVMDETRWADKNINVTSYVRALSQKAVFLGSVGRPRQDQPP